MSINTIIVFKLKKENLGSYFMILKRGPYVSSCLIAASLVLGQGVNNLLTVSLHPNLDCTCAVNYQVTVTELSHGHIRKSTCQVRGVSIIVRQADSHVLRPQGPRFNSMNHHKRQNAGARW